MKVVNLQAENFRILKAIEITPNGNVVTIGGKNGQGKSSVLDAIWVALAGRAKAPPTPVRKGEEKAVIRLDLGDIVVTRTFTVKEGAPYTDTVKVESADGKQRYQKPQALLDEMMGAIGFDPFAFVQRKPEDQADMLLQMVPLPIDLEELARLDNADFTNRRDINRDAASLDAQIKAIFVPEDLPEDAPDRAALTDRLAAAGDHNTGIERERMAREGQLRRIETIRSDSDTADASAAQLRERAAQLIAEAEGREADAKSGRAEADRLQAEFEALPALAEPIDTDAVRRELQAAEAVLAGIDAKARKAALVEQRAAKVADAEALTKAMEDREESRRKALAGARMPIEGLGFAINEKGKPVVMFNDLPFGDASSAEQIRASTAIAMAANPDLRVLRIKDGSLLDDDAKAIIAEMADAEDFQLWVEVVGTGGVGIVIEDGSIKGDAPLAEEKPAAKAKKGDAPAADKLL